MQLCRIVVLAGYVNIVDNICINGIMLMIVEKKSNKSVKAHKKRGNFPYIAFRPQADIIVF